MVGLVLYRPRKIPACGNRLGPVLGVEIRACHHCGADDLAADAGERKAPLFLADRPLPVHDSGVPHHEGHLHGRVERGVLGLFAPLRDVDDADALKPPDLLRREPHSLRVAHGLHHGLGKPHVVRPDRLHVAGLLPKHLLAIFEDLEQHRLHPPESVTSRQSTRSRPRPSRCRPLRPWRRPRPSTRAQRQTAPLCRPCGRKREPGRNSRV